MEDETFDFGKELFKAGKCILTTEFIYFEHHDEYTISVDRLWEARLDGENNKYDWLLHMPEKMWLTEEDIYALNTVFFYAIDLSADKPENKKLSIVKTLEEQRKVLIEKQNNFKFTK